MNGVNLQEFMREYRGISSVDATQVLPPKLLERVGREGKRLALVQNGMVVAAIVPTYDLERLEITDHGVSMLSDDADDI